MNSTLLFGQSRGGAGPGAPAPAPVPAAPTPPAVTDASPATTQPFGALPPEAFPPEMTQPFGGAGQKPMRFGEGLAASAQADLPAAPAPQQTQVFGAGALTDVVARADASSAKTPPVALPPEVQSAASGPGAARPQRPTQRLSSVALPPELMAGKASRPGDGRPAEPERKDGLLFVLGLLGVLVLTAALAYPAWRNRAGELPAEAMALRDEAAVLLRRDDATSREQAVARLRSLIAAHPTHTESRADLALALALELDDLLLDIQRMQVAEERLQREVLELGESKASADWAIRVNAMNSEIATLQRERGPLTQRLQALLNETEELQRSFQSVPTEEPAPAALARVRAQAVHAGVRGTNEGITLAERLRGLEEAPQPWAVVARAEYALNANSPPATLDEVATALEALREKDRTFLRAYLLGARVAMKRGDSTAAQALLDEALTLSPNHVLARKLHAWTVANLREAAPSP
jgi:tetratricopeptide (TPR) repeat protein